MGIDIAAFVGFLVSGEFWAVCGFWVCCLDFCSSAGGWGGLVRLCLRVVIVFAVRLLYLAVCGWFSVIFAALGLGFCG